MYQNIQLRQDTLENWNKVPEVVLKAGEIALVSTNNNSTYDAFKVGDGSSTFLELPLYYFIKSDKDGNPVIVNPLTQEPLDFARVDAYTKSLSISISSLFIQAIEWIFDSPKEVIDQPCINPFEGSVPDLQESRTYNILPLNHVSGHVTLLPITSDNIRVYDLEIWNTNPNEAPDIFSLTIEHTIDTSSWRIISGSSRLFPYSFILNLSSKYADLYSKILNSRDKNDALIINYEGNIYYNASVINQSTILLTKIEPYSLSTKGVGYLKVSNLYVEESNEGKVNINEEIKYIKLVDNLSKGLWLVDLPSSLADIPSGETVPVEDIWGSRANFLEWVKGLDPDNTGVSAWEVMLTKDFTRLGTLSKRVNTISGSEVTYYYITIQREEEDGLYVDKYKLYNNPDNNTIPIGDVVWFMGSYNLLETVLPVDIFDDTLQTLPAPTKENFDRYKNKIVGIPVLENGQIIKFEEYRIAWNLDPANPSYFWNSLSSSQPAGDFYTKTEIDDKFADEDTQIKKYVRDEIGKIPIPTKTSQLNNDSGFITSRALSGYATENYVINAISQSLGEIETILGGI